MNRDGIFKTIQAEAATILSISEEEIVENLKINDIDTWDSLAHLRLFMALEGVFNLKFDVGEITQTKSIGLITDLVLSKI